MQSNASENIATIGLSGVPGDIKLLFPLGTGDAIVSCGLLLFLEAAVEVTGE